MRIVKTPLPDLSVLPPILPPNLPRRMAAAVALAVGLTVQGAGPAQVQQSADTLLNCTACHALPPDGPAMFPVLNGQPADYLARQLEAYRTGARQHPQMQQTARLLGEGGALPMARMYAAAPPPRLRTPRGAFEDESTERLVFLGDPRRGIPSCASCHGTLRADPPGFEPGLARGAPVLHGQPQTYLAQTLRDYASGARRSDPMGRMRGISAALSDHEIGALAQYYASWETVR